MNPFTKPRDDRGDRYAIGGRPKPADAIAAGADKRMVARRLGNPAVDGGLYGALLGFSFAGGPSLAYMLYAVLPPVVSVPIIVGLFASVVALAVVMIRRCWRPLDPRAWLGLGLCPGCAYRLSGIETQADGCRVCPECGAAWKLDADETLPPR